MCNILSFLMEKLDKGIEQSFYIGLPSKRTELLVVMVVYFLVICWSSAEFHNVGIGEPHCWFQTINIY